MANTNESWIWKYDRWVIEKEHELIYRPLGEKIGDAFKEIGMMAWDWFVDVLPSIVGYGAVATGAFVILSSMAGRGMMKPLGIFAGVTIVAVCILEAN